MRTLLFLVLFSPFIGHSQDTMRVLFLGNSYTGVNNLPQLVADVATSAGDHVIFGSNTPGGYTLNGHSTNATSLQLIAQGNWDVVVLQEQSQFPSFPIGQVTADCFPFAAKLDSLITDANACTETMFYNTWGRKNGDASNCAGWPPVCTYEGMDNLLRLRYDQMAVDNEGVVSPVGPLWRYIRTSSPGLELYSADESHPSLAGSYAAACSFYSALFRKDPTLITTDAGVSAPDALTIRNSAKVVVYDSLLTWHIGEYDPVADFDVVESYATVNFTNQSTNACSYLWDFGDGTTSTNSDPTHVYTTPGTLFTYTLTAECCGISDTMSGTFIFQVGLDETETLENIQVSPNPTTDKLMIQLENLERIELIDTKGEKVEITPVKKGTGYQVDMSAFSSGIYWLKIESEGKLFKAKVVKE